MTEKRYPKLIEHLPRSFQIVIQTLVGRIDSGKNCLVSCVGPTGSGKSLSIVSMMYWIHIYMHGEEPSVEEMSHHWVFTALNFLKKMNNPELKKKEVWMWDESGFDMSHKTHMTVHNRSIGWLVQTFRNLQQVVFFTVPTSAFLDASIRKLLHYQLETRTILKTKEICIIKPLQLQYNIREDKLYYHNLVAPAVDGSGYLDEVDVIGVPRPPKHIEDEYELRAGKFKSDLNLKLQKTLQNLNNKEEMDLSDTGHLRPLTERQEKILKLLEEGVESVNEIAEVFGVNQSIISRNLGYMRGKGVNVDKFLKKTRL